MEESLPDTPSWRLADAVRLSSVLADHGVDLLDVSAAGNHHAQKFFFIRNAEAFQAHYSAAIKNSVGDKMLVGVVGGIRNGNTAQRLLDENQADVVFVGRWLQKNPALVWQFAEDLGVQISVAQQIEWPFRGRDSSVGRPHM